MMMMLVVVMAMMLEGYEAASFSVEAHHMLARGGITSKAGGLRGGGILSSTVIMIMI